MASELKPCPCCGSTDVHQDHSAAPVYCMNKACGMRGLSVKRWNTRPTDRLAVAREALEKIAKDVFVAEPAGTPDSPFRVALNERIELACTALTEIGGSDES